MTFDLSVLHDPTVVGENRLPARSDHRWFASREEAWAPPVHVEDLLASPQVESSFERSLNGRWKFHYAQNPAEMMPGFQDPDFDTSNWADIEVPGHLQLQGYDRPQYVNTQYPWDGREEVEPGRAPTDFNPVGQYVREFDWDPRNFPDTNVIIRFNGIENAGAVWLNGHYVGYGLDTFTPTEFDVTDFLVDGPNKLAVDVFKWSAASWLEDQDFYRFSGIFRDVLLLVKPEVHAEDIRVTTELADDFTSARIRLDVELSGSGSVRATLDGAGPLVAANDGSLSIDIRDPELWSPENPFLYTLEIEVLDAEGKLTEFIPQKVGLRRFGIEDGVLKLNGQRVVFKGVNRHEFGPNGRVFNREDTVADLELLKQAGVNAIRTSHYPNNSFFYELADQYGFLVMGEMNLEAHGLWDPIHYGVWPEEMAVPGDNRAWLPAVLDRAQNMVQRDKNHPAIVMWSSGNESYGGLNLKKVADYFREVDPSRPVHYEGVMWDRRYPDSSDVESQMYTPATKVEEFLEDNRDKPFILCEYAHNMGNSFGAVDKYIDLAYRDPLFQGGFIWDFADQAILMEDDKGNEYFAFGGENAEAPHDGAFCGNGVLFADHTPKPMFQELKRLYQGLEISVEETEFTVENRFLFTNSSAYECLVSLSSEGTVLEQDVVDTDVAPGDSATYAVPFTVPQDAGEYTVDVSFRLSEDTVWADADFEIAYGQAALLRVDPAADASSAGAAGLRVVAGIHNIGVRGENFAVLFSRLAGGLQSYRFGGGPEGGRELLKAVPVPNFWQAPTDNSIAWAGPGEDGQWLLASRYAQPNRGPEFPSVSADEAGVTVTYSYDLPTVPASTCEVTYLVTDDGRVQVTANLEPGDGLTAPPEFGMLFKTLPSLDMLTWYGEGPNESSIDRRKGARLGVYEETVQEQLTPYLRLQEAGNHTGVRWAKVTDQDGHGLIFDYPGLGDPKKADSAEAGMEFSALPWSPFEVENADHHHQLPPIHATWVRPALMRRGVGGDDTWGARVHPEYLVPTGPLSFTFGFRGI